MRQFKNQIGAVSLFVVIFSALLITVITVGFVGIMIRDQKQASDNDLSQSAYDSALAGVEDAKRAIIRYQNCVTGLETEGCDDTNVVSSLALQNCTNVVSNLVGAELSDGEVKVQTDSANSLNQAYTCVKVAMDTPDYLGVLDRDATKVIPLKGVSAFNAVRIEWTNKSDIGGQSTVSLLNSATLSKSSNWPLKRPSLIRAQFIQVPHAGYLLEDLDQSNTVDKASSQTMFLYPSTSGVNNVSISTFDSRARTGVSSLINKVTCTNISATVSYSCSVLINLPTPVDSSRTAYLSLQALYNRANYRVTLLGGSPQTTVNFAGVQPEIDSTGRANDLFRRVKSRVELVNDANIFPTAAVDVSTGFCKDYIFYGAAELAPGNNCTYL